MLITPAISPSNNGLEELYEIHSVLPWGNGFLIPPPNQYHLKQDYSKGVEIEYRNICLGLFQSHWNEGYGKTLQL